MFYDKYYPFKVMKLPYGYDSLAPDISGPANFFHYNEHYVPAMEKLNRIVKDKGIYQLIPIEKLAKSKDTELRRAAESVLAHELHFSSLTDKKSEPSEYMKKRIETDFGSAENMLKAIKDAASELYGSGYVWLAEDGTGKLVPLITKEHDIPDPDKYKPVYALDLWEHAYYPDRQNHREDYVGAALRHINWDNIESLLKKQ